MVQRHVVTDDYRSRHSDKCPGLTHVYRTCWHSICTGLIHYGDVIMSAMASQITSLTIVYSTFYSGADQRKHQSSASLASVRGIHRWSVNSPHKGLVTRKIFPFDDVIMLIFADASRVNLYHSYHPVSWMQQSTNLSTKRRKTQVRPLQCRGWPWIHNTSHTRPVLTIPVTMLVHQHSGGGGGDDHKSVQGICLDALSDIQHPLNVFGPWGKIDTAFNSPD